MKEQDLVAKIIKLLVAHGFDVVKIIRCNRNGVSDIIACAPNGIFWAIEVKIGNNKPSPLQLYYIEQIKQRNGVAFVTWDIATVKTYLDTHAIAKINVPSKQSLL